MSEPTLVKLKRKRNEEPLEFLVLQGGEDGITYPRYQRQKTQEDAEKNTETHDPLQTTTLPSVTANGESQTTQRRIFELQRKPQNSPDLKRKDADETIATFVEKKQRRKDTTASGPEPALPEEDTAPQTPLKRPGKGARLHTPTKTSPSPHIETDAQRKELEALAAYLHSAALETQTRPAPVSTPKLSGARSQALHRQRQRAATNGSVGMMDVDDEDSYVYDTYILAPSLDPGAMAMDEVDALDMAGGSVGYLVISEDDRSLWETYLEEEQQSDREEDSGEEDENAEGWVGAEYPDDEDEEGSLGSEVDWFGYSRGRAGEEEWDEDTGAWSDDEEALREGRTPGRFSHFEVGLESR